MSIILDYERDNEFIITLPQIKQILEYYDKKKESNHIAAKSIILTKLAQELPRVKKVKVE